MEVEIAIAVIFAATLVIGALLGLVAFWKVRKLQGVPGRVERLAAEVEALRREVMARPAAPLDIPAAPLDIEEKPASSQDKPTVAPWGEPRQEGSKAPEPHTPENIPAAPASPEPDKVTARSNEDPKTSGPSPKTPPRPPVDGPAAGKSAPKNDLESTVGALWAVWVGGIALAFGGIFLVRYSIEQGWLGPVARVTFGLVFGAILAALGEWTRRRGQAFSFVGYEKANVPAILTAAGTVAAFASIYAAYALYALISPAIAFVLLGVVAVAALAAALLHGILLAAVGLLGSYCVPFLVSTDTPNPLALALYIFIVSAAAFGVGRIRLWRWLAIAATGGLVFWGLVLISISGASDRVVVFGYILAAWAMIFYVFVASLYRRDPKQFVNWDAAATSALAAMLLLLLAAILFQPYDALTILVLVLTIAACFGAAFFYAASRYVILAGIVVVVPGYLGWSIPLDDLMLYTDSIGSSHGISTPILEDIRRSADTAFVWTGIVLAGVAAALGLFGTLRSASRALLAIGGAGLPILLLCVAYIRMEMFQASLLFGGLSLLLGLALGAIANRLFVQLPQSEPAREEAISAYAIASIAAIALALAFTLEHGALTIALALVVPATAFVYARRPLGALRPVAVIAALLWVARIVWDPRIVGDDLGTVPIFNWLTYGYGIPTAAFALSAWLLGSHRRDIWLEILEAITIASLAGTLALVGLHALEPTEVFTPFDTLAEAAIIALVSGGIALGLLRISRTESSRSMAAATNVLGYAGMAVSALGLLFVWNPLLTGEQISRGLVFNQLSFGYLVPAGLYAFLALTSRGKRPEIYSNGSAAISFALFATWVTLTIRHAFHPADLYYGPTTNAELYTYSAVWLAIGLSVLITGIMTGLRPVRLLSGAILIGVVAKVFLIDMANLTGVLRALSFIGLGVVLIGIGLVYQRLLRKPPEQAEEAEREPEA